jgi:hypothetical protein
LAFVVSILGGTWPDSAFVQRIPGDVMPLKILLVSYRVVPMFLFAQDGWWPLGDAESGEDDVGRGLERE